MAERELPKLEVMGSTPTARSIFSGAISHLFVDSKRLTKAKSQIIFCTISYIICKNNAFLAPFGA